MWLATSSVPAGRGAFMCGLPVCRVGKESHSGGLENLLSASSLAETHISPDDIPYFNDHDDNRTLH